MPFESVPIPGQSDDVSAEQVLAEIDQWLTSEAFCFLLREFGSGSPTGDLLERLAFLEGMSTLWDYRGQAARTKRRAEVAGAEGEKIPVAQTERDAVGGGDFTPQEQAQVLDAAKALGLVEAARPRSSEYDYVVVLGGLVRANYWRSLYAAKLLRDGITSPSIVGLTAFRPLTNPEREILPVFELTDRRYEYEYEVLETCLRSAFKIEAFDTETDDESTDAANPADPLHRTRTASAQAAGGQVTIVGAGTLDPRGAWRADTAATYERWGQQVKLGKQHRVLAVTTSIYVPYQHAVALQRLTLISAAGWKPLELTRPTWATTRLHKDSPR